MLSEEADVKYAPISTYAFDPLLSLSTVRLL